MIAITFALPAESSDLLRRVESKRLTTVGKLKVFAGNIAGYDLSVCHTGVGRSHCRANIETFLQSVQPNLVISSGFAGSLREELQPGDVILARNYSDSALAWRVLEGGAPATPSEWSIRSVAGSPATAGKLQLDPPSFRAVKLLTVDSMVHSAAERSRLAEAHQADAADMETDMIARACAARGIPMLSLRVISDSPAAPFPMPPNVLFDIARQRTNFGKLVPYALTHPLAAIDLIRFGRRISRVQKILTEALIEAITIMG